MTTEGRQPRHASLNLAEMITVIGRVRRIEEIDSATAANAVARELLDGIASGPERTPSCLGVRIYVTSPCSESKAQDPVASGRCLHLVAHCGDSFASGGDLAWLTADEVSIHSPDELDALPPLALLLHQVGLDPAWLIGGGSLSLANAPSRPGVMYLDRSHRYRVAGADRMIPSRSESIVGIARVLPSLQVFCCFLLLSVTLDRQSLDFFRPLGFAIGLALNPYRSDPAAKLAAIEQLLDLQEESMVGLSARQQVITLELEELARENDRLGRVRADFLATMSHELRTPLNAIMGFSELLMDDTSGRVDQATRTRFLEGVHANGERLLGLISNILDYSEIEAGRMKLRLETVAVAVVVDQVVSAVTPLAAQKRIRLEADVGEAGHVVADAGKLKQMVLQLVSNAVKFTPDSGAVRIAARRLSGTIEISVTDTGIGIAAGDRGRIFEVFQQLDSGLARQQQGTGLGLALSKSYAHMHGGDLRFESEEGKGSVFTLSLPLELAKSAGPPAPAATTRSWVGNH